ncbi:hypothetical protein U1Q18_003380 [Sarracenia purpurea var. burkii]
MKPLSLETYGMIILHLRKWGSRGRRKRGVREQERRRVNFEAGSSESIEVDSEVEEDGTEVVSRRTKVGIKQMFKSEQEGNELHRLSPDVVKMRVGVKLWVEDGVAITRPGRDWKFSHGEVQYDKACLGRDLRRWGQLDEF